jgi:hypothetical protein
MRWATYFAVLASVLSVGFALGVSMPLVSLRLESWGYGNFAIGIMAAMPAFGVLLGAKVSSRLASLVGHGEPDASVPVGWGDFHRFAGGTAQLSGVAGAAVDDRGDPDHRVYPRRKLDQSTGGGAVAWPAGGAVWLYLRLEPAVGAVVARRTGFTDHDYGFWVGVGLLIIAPFLLLGRSGAPTAEAFSVTFGDLWRFCRGLPAIAWAVALFAAFEAMILTLLPVYCLQQGFTAEVALAMVSTVVVGDALLQLPIGALADYLPQAYPVSGCAVLLLLSSLAIAPLLDTWLIWPIWVLFGASAGGLFTLSLILIGERYRDDALVRANAHIAQLWGIGCLIGPLAAGAGSQWISGHALPLLMAAGALGLVILLLRQGAFGAEQPA